MSLTESTRPSWHFTVVNENKYSPFFPVKQYPCVVHVIAFLNSSIPPGTTLRCQTSAHIQDGLHPALTALVHITFTFFSFTINDLNTAKLLYKCRCAEMYLNTWLSILIRAKPETGYCHDDCSQMCKSFTKPVTCISVLYQYAAQYCS